jgi:hypothetical protein
MMRRLARQTRPQTVMPLGQAVLLWLQQHMPITAERVRAVARSRGEPPEGEAGAEGHG